MASNTQKQSHPSKEMVNHPSHYKQNIECIDAMIDCFGKASTAAFCKLNAFKYIWRSDRKGKDLEDMKKAQWYITEYIKLNEQHLIE